jgi:putative hemolysin
MIYPGPRRDSPLGGTGMFGPLPRGLIRPIDFRQWGITMPPSKLRPGLRQSLCANAGLPDSLGRLGPLEVRLARRTREIKTAQRLRYQVFYEEMSALPDPVSRLSRRDRDAYDAVCDHLLVLDHSRRSSPVVGTYRLLRQTVADRSLGFYTAGEFDIGPMLATHRGKRFLELGRSCVAAPYRTRKTVELLWAGIWHYVRHHAVDVMLGCASLEGTDPARLSLPLSFLHHHARAESPWSAKALAERYIRMDRLAPEAVDAKAAIQALPPLVKGYLRLGASFGDGAVIDRQFGTTDVLVILPVERIPPRYRDYFGGEEARRSAA